MNKPLLHVLLSLLMCLTLLLTVTAQVVDIPDPNLRTKIEETLGKASGATITASDMERLTRLEARNANISDLTRLEHATNLVHLNLRRNNISDISQVRGLTNLITLNLRGNNISDVLPVADLTKLTFLELVGNSISDISPVGGLTNLTQLYLDSNSVSDISALASLTSLTRLGLEGNEILDISALAGLTNLTWMRVGWNNITDLSPVAGLTNLKTLRLERNNISDISSLVANPGLRSGDEVYVQGNPLGYLSLQTHIPTLRSRGVTIDLEDTMDLNIGEPHTVRMIYFLPNDRPYRPDVVQLMKDRILQVQTFFAEQMAAHGYGNKTFRVETDAQDEPMVHRMDGQYPDHHYSDYWESIVWPEIGDVFNRYTNIYLIVADTINTKVGEGSRLGKNAGTAVVGSDVNFRVTAHELGHAFGLWHDFRDGSYLMSYGPGSKDQLAVCHADFLDAHPYFNPNSLIEERPPPTIELISPDTYPADSKSLPIRLKVSDSDGLHQVILHLGPPDHTNRITVKSCRGLGGKKEAVVQFDYDGVIPFAHNLPYSRSTSLLNPLVHPIFVEAVDTNGNVGEQFFFLSSDMYQPSSQPSSDTLSKISGDNQQGLPNTPLLQPFVVEVRKANGFTFGGMPVGFAVTAGDGTLSRQFTVTDGNGRVSSTLTLGPNLGTNAVEVSAGGIDGAVTFTAVAVKVSGTAVEIPDPNLLAAVEDAFKKAPGTPITTTEMTWLPRLEAPNANISDLTGLEGATNLTELYLGPEWVEGTGWVNSNAISDLSLLLGLTNLIRLDLRGNNIVDVSPLAGLTNLTWLRLGYNSISDISLVAGLTNLTYLNLGDNLMIPDISPLAGLTNLTELILWNNNISDISPLAGLTNLTELNLRHNNISDISPLAGLINLTELNLRHNDISDISPVIANTGLGNGDEVLLNDNPLSSVSIKTYVPELQSRGVTVEFDDTKTRTVDVNGDGVVNVLDLVVIASEFENTGANLAADVSGDGVVNIFDIVLVVGMFDGAAAAPSAQPQTPDTLTAVEVQGWLTDATALEVSDPIMKRGFMVLEQLLLSLTPKETELLANYPNPFNPETWIPYRLAEDAFVRLTIYDLGGRVVRTFNVGHRIASAYESQSKAIYWDGRNDVGESVASGVYFYTLAAGDFSATRKMLILK